MTLEEKLAAIAALEREADSPDLAQRCAAWLADASNVVVERAAKAAAQRGLDETTPALIDAFFRLLRHPQPATVDKTCRAKEAIVLALDALGNPDVEPYTAGLRHVQLEAAFGGRVDTAAELRGQCAIALARRRPVDTAFLLAPLLFDHELAPRLAAIRALAYTGDEQSELLLRVKVLAGDTEPEVLGECFTGLLVMEPERSLPFVADYLHAAERATAEQAALALGQSRLPEAVALLRAGWEANTDLDLRRSLLLALALTRSDEAFTFLLDIMRDAGGTSALLACDALALYGTDRRFRERIEEVVAKCKQPRLTDAYLAHFPPAP